MDHFKESVAQITEQLIIDKIYLIREQKVMIDKDLIEI